MKMKNVVKKTNPLVGGRKYKKFFITVHNDVGDDVVTKFANVVTSKFDNGEVRWCIIGPAEISETEAAGNNERTHHHVLLHLETSIGLPGIQEFWEEMDMPEGGRGGTRWEHQSGTDEEAIKYALKTGGAPFLAVGDESVTHQGKRKCDHDWIADFKEMVKDGTIRAYEDALEHASYVSARYYQFVNDYIDKHVSHDPELPENYQLKIWQVDILDNCLKLDPDGRTVVFATDSEGNSGKSWFCRYLPKLLPDKIVQVLRPEKNRDLAMQLNVNADVICIDVPREVTMDADKKILQYRLLEEIKDGYVSSSKFRVRMKYMKPCHVIVFMNHDPHPHALSEDRYVIYPITRDRCEFHVRHDPMVPNSGPEFNGDIAGDGPVFNASAFREAFGKEEQARIRSPVMQLSRNVPIYIGYYEGDSCIIPGTAVHRFWCEGIFPVQYPLKVPRSSPFLVQVLWGDTRHLDEWCRNHLNWNGEGHMELVVNLNRHPSKRDLVKRASKTLPLPERMERWNVNGERYFIYPPIRAPRTAYMPVGDKMCFGTAHAFQQEYGNVTGNPGGAVSVELPMDDPTKWQEQRRRYAPSTEMEQYEAYKKFILELKPIDVIDGAYYYDPDGDLIKYVAIDKKRII